MNDPKAGTMQGVIIDGILKRPEFAGVHVVPVSKGEGAGALARGEGDMAIQLVPEILNKPPIDLVAPLPVELGGHMDAILAVSARSSRSEERHGLRQIPGRSGCALRLGGERPQALLAISVSRLYRQPSTPLVPRGG